MFDSYFTGDLKRIALCTEIGVTAANTSNKNAEIPRNSVVFTGLPLFFHLRIANGQPVATLIPWAIYP
jgi:hypothetical protein